MDHLCLGLLDVALPVEEAVIPFLHKMALLSLQWNVLNFQAQ